MHNFVVNNKTLLAFVYILIVIMISIVMFANAIKRKKTVGIILSVINITIPFVPLIIYLVLVYYDKYINIKDKLD